MKVGGNKDIAANSNVWPATVAPFMETTQRLLSLLAVVEGFMLNWMNCHEVLEVKEAVVEQRV